MTIKTKYDIGDKIWTIYCNKVRELNIVEIYIERKFKDIGKEAKDLIPDNRIVYKVSEKSEYDYCTHMTKDGMNTYENLIYKTKEELLKKL